ncbi:MAG: HNH endonuclease [Hymenobacter sp.]|nr:MAG: HNH endonuclease [Hymenobacter sp.]
MDQKVLVLNGDYTAITLCSVQKAFVLLFLDKAEMVAKSEQGVMRTISQSFPKPSIIRLARYVRVPYKGIALSRHNIFKRDHGECQYCGSSKNLTLDHVMPRSRGGDSGWTNLVTACSRCNHAKGQRTPSEANMPLRTQPKKPTLTGFLKLSAGTLDQNWHAYLG